ncbi:MAG: hypothetical protein F7C07_04590 [Desulfurococcales archaeon]|nr:hypothetical protein [Desulfurococcales archaeon]
MHESADSGPRELPPIEFRRVLGNGFERLEEGKELRDVTQSLLGMFNNLCLKIDDRCALRLVLETEPYTMSGGFYEVRVFKRDPKSYSIVSNIDSNFNSRGVYAVSYEFFLVSDDMIDLETSRASSLRMKLLHRENLNEVLAELLALLGYEQYSRPTQAGVGIEDLGHESWEDSRPEALRVCLDYIREHDPSVNPAGAILQAIVDGIGYYRSEENVYCLARTNQGEASNNDECQYMLLAIRNEKLLESKCYRSSAEFLSELGFLLY